MSLLLRRAFVADLDAINDIYNHYVRTSTCTYDVEPTTIADRRAWLDAHGEGHPVTVAEDGGTIVGFGALSPFRGRYGYRFTVENTVYVREDRHRRGLGRTILEDLLGRATALGYRSVVAGISGDQTASIALHARCGFERVAFLRGVGHKFDRWLDLVLMQKMLAA